MRKLTSLFCILISLLTACSFFAPQPGSGGAPTLAATEMPALPPASALPTFTRIPTFAPPPTATIFPIKDYPDCSPADVQAYQPAASAEASKTQPNRSAVPTLRSLAEKRNLYIGAATDAGYFKTPGYTDLLAQQFNILVPEVAMEWEIIHPQPGTYDFKRGDAIVAAAQANGQAVYGHTLIWDLMLPDWITEGRFTHDEWVNLLCTHIKTLVSHYKGQIYAWNVVNEPFTDEGLLRDTIFLREIGPEYIYLAFKWAHEADPMARLLFNEHNSEGLNAKSQAVYALARGLRQRGIPLDAVGLQMHVWLHGPPTQQDLAANMQRLAGLGLQAYITEMDVRTQYNDDSPEQKLAAQAEIYRQAFATCLNASNCPVFITWGVTDAQSWIPGYTGHPDMPLLFDTKSAPKPAYYAILDLLQNP